MQKKILSISEINEIEQAYKHGVPCLGSAAIELINRWQNNLKDEETCIRLIFLLWYKCSEPEFLTGLNVELPAVIDIFNEFGEDNLSAESIFVLGILGNLFPHCLGEENFWQEKSRELLKQASIKQPSSYLFSDWTFFINEADERKSLKTKLVGEIHARFFGRGYFGEYLLHILNFSLKNNT